MTSKLPQGVHIQDGQILMTYEANKKFRDNFGDFVPALADGQLYVQCGRRMVFIDENMKTKKLGTVCIVEGNTMLQSRTNITNCETTTSNHNKSDNKLKDEISAIAYSMLESETNFEFTEITKKKYTRYFPYQFNKHHIFVIVFDDYHNIVFENIIEEEDYKSHRIVEYKLPNSFPRLYQIGANNWINCMRDTNGNMGYQIFLFRF
jgi:hypothetical protein